MDDGISVAAGLLVALVVGVSSHWSAGAAVFAAWIVLHGLTWGFAAFGHRGGRQALPAAMEPCR
jgi:hypothetical protein